MTDRRPSFVLIVVKAGFNFAIAFGLVFACAFALTWVAEAEQVLPWVRARSGFLLWKLPAYVGGAMAALSLVSLLLAQRRLKDTEEAS